MKKTIAMLLLLSLLGLGACSAPKEGEEDTLTLVATTYPVYLFTTAVTQGAEGVEVKLLVNQQTSCLHDYTLTVGDMKAIEGADVIVMNGAGLEDFLSDALAGSQAAVIDCSAGVEMLEESGHEGHDHDTTWDPHIWMDPERAAQMTENLAEGLAAADEANAALYRENGTTTAEQLRACAEECRAMVEQSEATRYLITFHNGFGYFADAFGLTILKAIEEEEGAEASAQEIREIVALIGEYDLPAIFTEVNGSDSTAQAIARETGCGVAQLDMIMSGDGSGIQPYLDAMTQNVQTLVDALGEGKV